MRAAAAVAVAVGLLLASPVSAQPAADPPALGVRGFVDVGALSPSASQSFDAVLDRTSAATIGGGAQLMLRSGIYVEVAAYRFQETGQRVFVHDGEVFGLGIPTRVTLQPVDVSAGYRFGGSRRVVAYAGGGLGSQLYRETSDFADADEDVEARHASYHLGGGVEYRVQRWLALGVHLSHRWVPDAIGGAGVSEAFGETDLGGTAAGFRISIGR